MCATAWLLHNSMHNSSHNSITHNCNVYFNLKTTQQLKSTCHSTQGRGFRDSDAVRSPMHKSMQSTTLLPSRKECHRNDATSLVAIATASGRLAQKDPHGLHTHAQVLQIRQHRCPEVVPLLDGLLRVRLRIGRHARSADDGASLGVGLLHIFEELVRFITGLGRVPRTGLVANLCASLQTCSPRCGPFPRL